MMTVFREIVCAVLWTGFVWAEMRTWTDVDGTHFKGKFRRELLGGIQVYDTDGRGRLLPVDKLSSRDLMYLKHHIVPEVKIDFKKSSRFRPEMEWTIDQDKTTLYTCEIRLEKKSKLDCKSKLTVELYIIAEEVDGHNYVLVQREALSFVFPEGKDSSYEFVVRDIPIRRYYASWADQAAKFRGASYLGYIVTVLDSGNKLLAYDTDLKTESWLEMGISEAVEKLRALALEGRGSVYSRHFDDKIRKSRLPRIKWHKRTATF